MDILKRDRNTGIELLRILAMCGVVMLHINMYAFKDVTPESMNYYSLFVLESISICAVDLYMLISGYFLCTSKKRSLVKPLELLLQVIAFKQILLVKFLLYPSMFTTEAFLLGLIPNNYFVLLYIVVYLLSPYLNILFEKFDKLQWNKCLILLIFIFSFWNTLGDLSGEAIGKQWFGFSTIGAWGNQSGMNIVNFFLLYTIGAYLRFNGFIGYLKSKSQAVLLWLLCIAFIFVWALFCNKLVLTGLRSAWVYHNPLVIISAILLFYIFSNINFNSELINKLATASFTCFLLHIKIIGYVYIHVKSFVTQPLYVMLAFIIFLIAVIYLISYIVFLLYLFITKPISLKLKEIISSKSIFNNITGL